MQILHSQQDAQPSFTTGSQSAMHGLSKCVPALPLQVWGMIIEKARPCVPDFKAYHDSYDMISAVRVPMSIRVFSKNLEWFIALRQVCKGFLKEFERDPLNVALCVLWNSDQPPDRSELLKLFRRKDQVEQLLLFKRPMCLGSSVAALQALRSTGSQLSSVMLADPKQLEVSCCAAFTALTSWTFVHSCPPYYRFGPYREYTELSLQPLQALPRLSTLVLQRGNFSGLDSIQHLTRLQMQNAKVEASNDCVLIESLSHLHVVDWGELFGLHTLGVFSCKRLVHLYVKGGLIAAENDNHWPASLENEYEISPSLATLTLLTCLKLHPGIRPGYPWKWTGLEYVTHLTNLQQLEIGSCRYPFTVPTGISTLSILSSLRVFSSHTAAVRLDVDCFPLHSLREVQFDLDLTSLIQSYWH